MKLLGPDIGITDLLDYEIQEKLKKEQEDKKAGRIKYHPLRPSSAGHCSRKLALELMEYRGKAFYDRPLIAPNVYRLFELGHSVEFAALRTFQLIKVVEQKYKQQSVTLFPLKRGLEELKEEIVEGSCDFVLYSKQFRCIGDVKSKKDGFSSYRASKWDEELTKFSKMESLYKISDTAFYADNLPSFIKELGDDFLVDNLVQLNLYAMSHFMQERKIDYAFLYRYNKNDSRHMEIRFRPSKELFNEVERKFNKIAKEVDNEVVPSSCEFPVGSIRFAFCDCHKMLSYFESDPIKTYFQTLPPKRWPKKVDTLQGAAPLLEAYSDYKSSEQHLLHRSQAEKTIIEILTKQKVSKVKFEDGDVYEVKFLKTPREHFELRRSK